MNISQRKTLALLGGGFIVAAGTGETAFVTTRRPGTALAPWQNDRVSQIDAVGAWLRLNLKTTELGLALHPLSQALQEYEEMNSNFARAHQLLAGNGEPVQMLGRLGYGPKIAPAPRWPLEAKLLNG